MLYEEYIDTSKTDQKYIISFTVNEELNNNQDDLWDNLSNIGHFDLFHPQVKNSKTIGDIPSGLGSRALWEFDEKGEYVIEEVSQYKVGSLIAVKLIEGTIPFDYAETIFTLDPINNTQTNVKITMHFKLKGSVFGAILGHLIIKNKLKQRMVFFLAELERHIIQTNLGN